MFEDDPPEADRENIPAKRGPGRPRNPPAPPKPPKSPRPPRPASPTTERAYVVQFAGEKDPQIINATSYRIRGNYVEFWHLPDPGTVAKKPEVYHHTRIVSFHAL